MKFEELSKNYLAIDKYLFREGKLNDHIKDILSRGYFCCNNDEVRQNVKILLTGINPSFPPKSRRIPHGIIPYTFQTAVGGYWAKKRSQFGELLPYMAYLDLFPIRESHQDKGFEKAFEEANNIRAKFLEFTQMTIEDMAPKLLVHANRDSMYYWGIRKYGCGNDTENPWMGYDVERITRDNAPDLPECCTEERLRRFPLYRINGFVPSEKRINKGNLRKTNLSYIMEYVMEYRKKEYKEFLYTSEEWKEIINYLFYK